MVLLRSTCMSIILALDTSSDYCSVALSHNGQVDEIRKQAPRQHTQLLLPLVDEILARHQMPLSLVDAIAFGLGPGSFTGLRICFATVQGLAFGADIPVIGVSTLHAMAQSAQQLDSESQPDSIYVPMLDARMGQVYWGAYQFADGLMALQPDSLNDPIDCLVPLEGYQPSKIIPIGPGWHYPVLQAWGGKPVQTDQQQKIESWAMAIVSLAQDVGREDWQDIRGVQPVYLRDEISWQKRQRIRT